MELTQDDKIRQHATQQLRSYFRLDFKQFEEFFNINPKDYFSKEIDFLDEMIEDGLVIISDNALEMTELGKDFSQNISNVFDKYDPPTKSYEARLKTIKKVKLNQANIQI